MVKRKRKSSLSKLLESNDENIYETTREDVDRWFHILNRELFDNVLRPFDEIDIRWRRRSHAYYHCVHESDPKKPKYQYTKLCMNKKYTNKKFFAEILAHELVHHYQFTHGEHFGHGRSFTRWNNIFLKKGMRLHKVYYNED